MMKMTTSAYTEFLKKTQLSKCGMCDSAMDDAGRPNVYLENGRANFFFVATQEDVPNECWEIDILKAHASIAGIVFVAFDTGRYFYLAEDYVTHVDKVSREYRLMCPFGAVYGCPHYRSVYLPTISLLSLWQKLVAFAKRLWRKQ